MMITFLGTGASSSFPLPFCQCETCRKARELGGKNLRKRSSLLVNKDLIIDYGPDVVSASFMHGIDLSQIQYCLQTHSHSDHFDASHIITRLPEYAVENVSVLHLASSELTMHHLNEHLKQQSDDVDLFNPQFLEKMKMEIHILKPNQSSSFGIYQVFAFSTDHDRQDGSMIYAIQQDQTTLLYATDTTVFTEDTWQAFRIHKLHFDVVILDQTYGLGIPGSGHLNANQVIAHIKGLGREKLIDPSTQLWATHLSHEGNSILKVADKISRQYGYHIAYDGLIIKF